MLKRIDLYIFLHWHFKKDDFKYTEFNLKP